MANIKNFGIAGVSADVQMGKSGGRLVYDSGNTLFKFTTSDGSTLAKLRVAEPSGTTDAASKGYVDGVASGLDVKDSVRVATTAAGTLSSSFANGSTVDGISLATNDRILIQDQVSGAENGIYTVNASGAPTRATDFDADSEVTAGAFTFVEEGTTNADNGFVLTTDGTITVGTTAIAFAQFSGAGSIIAGAGLTKSGSTLNVIAGTGITVNANDVQISASYAGQNTITTLGTVATGTWNGTGIANAYVDNDLTISGGTVDNSIIGGTTPVAGTFTTLTANTSLVGTLGTAAQGSVTSLGTLTALNVDNLNLNGNAITSTDSNGNIDLTPHGVGEVNITKVDIDGGAIDGTIIGANSAVAGTFGALTSTGTSTHASVDINGGAIDGTNIGAASVGTGAFSTISATGTTTGVAANYSGAVGVDGNFDVATNKFTVAAATGNTVVAGTLGVTGLSTLATVDVGGGAIDGTIVGAASAAAGTFTALTATGTSTLPVINGSGAWTNTGTLTAGTVDINGGAIDGTNIGANAQGTGRFSSLQADTLAGALNASSQAITNVNIDSGAIDGTPIGANSVSTGAFGALTSTSHVSSGNISGVDGTFSGNLAVTGNIVGSGNLTISGDTVTANVTTITIEDPLMLLSSSAADAGTVDAGFVVERGSSANVALLWDESADEFAAISTTDTGTTAGNVTIAAYADFKAKDVQAGGALTAAGATTLSGALTVSGGGAVALGASALTGSGAWTHTGTLTAGTVDINGGAIDGTAIGAASASTGAFSTLSATGTSTLTTVDINAGNIDNTVIGASTAVAGTFAALTATGTSTLSTVDINAGAIDGTAIGANSVSTGAFSTISATGAITGDLTGDVAGNVTSTGTSTFTTVDINGGAIDGTNIGANQVGTGHFSTLGATGTLTGVAANFSGAVGVDGNFDVATNKFTVNATSGNTQVAGTLGSTGAITASAGVTGDLTGNVAGNVTSTGTSTFTTVDINGGAIDGTAIGANSASTGAFSTLSATGTTTGVAANFSGAVGVDGNFDVATNKMTVAAASGNTTIAGTLGVTGAITGALTGNVTGNVTGDLTGNSAGTHTGAVSGNVTSTGTSTFTTVDINGCAIDGTIIGANAAVAADFTTMDATGNVTIGGTLAVTGNTTLTGNLTINGTTTDVSTVNTVIEDAVIMVNNGESGASVTGVFSGISVDRGSSANAHMVFDDGQDRWEFLTGHDTIASASLGNVAFGTVGAGTWQGTAIADTYVANDLTISGGTVNNSVIGGSTAAAGTFTTLGFDTLGSAVDMGNQNLTNVDIDSGAIDGTVIGAASAAAITGTTITASSSLVGTLGTASQTNVTGLGTIGTGVWQGTAVAAGFGGTGIDTSSSTGAVRVDSGTWSVGDVSLTADVSGTLPVANGGTGITSGTTNQFLKFTGSTTIGAGYAEDLYANDVKVFSASGATTSGAGEGVKLTNASGKAYFRSVNTAGSGDVDLYLGAQDSGDVVIEGTGNGVVKGDNDLDLTVRGGDSSAADAGDLILSGGNGTGSNASGNVYIQGGLGGSANGNVQIRDANGLEVLKFTETGSAVNEMTIANAATSGTPTLSTTGSDTNITLLISPKGSGVINVPASYAARAGFGTNSLATKEYVDNNSSTETFARRASFTANSSANDFAVGTINSGTTNYINRVTVAVTTALSGGSVSGVRLHDGTAYLTALDDCDTSETGTYVIDLPTSTATAASAVLTAKVVQSNGTTASVPTAGVVVVTAQWVKV